MSGPDISKMKPKKRKAEKPRDSADAKRSRRGKGLLVPPNSFNVDSPDSSEAGTTETNVSIISQYGRRVSAPKRLSDDSTEPETPAPCSNTKPPERRIPTPGFRLVEENKNPTDLPDTESDSEEEEEGLLRAREERLENEKRSRNTRSSGKAMYKGLLNRGRACSCSVLVIEFDRGWRESGATVEMFSGHRGWYICVLQQEETLFIQEIRRKYFNYTTNKVTGAYIWRAEQDWMLEFDTYSQLSIFKKLYEKCFLKNQGAAAMIQSPASKFRVVKDLDPRWRGPAFIRPAHEYMSPAEVDLDARVLYDMDSEDEKWLSEINGKAGTYKQKISEHKFEKAIYSMEKYSHDRNELLSERMASVLCLHVASLKIIKLVHGYWIEKRRRKGTSLVRHFQYRNVEYEKTPEKSPTCSPTKEPSIGETVQNNSLEEPVQTKETTQPAGSDSPSLPEVCNETPAAAAAEAESSLPQQTQLVWKKFTGRASAEERKKLRVMNQLRQSGIKHFTRRKKDKKSSGKSITETTISVEEAARELYALADAARLKDFTVTEVGKCKPPPEPPVENSEAESDIETLELAREQAPPANPPKQPLTKLQREKLRLKQQMQKLKQQMRSVDDQMSGKQMRAVDDQLNMKQVRYVDDEMNRKQVRAVDDQMIRKKKKKRKSSRKKKPGEVSVWSVEVEDDFNEEQARRSSKPDVGFKRIRRTKPTLVAL